MNKTTYLYVAWTFGIMFVSWFVWWLLLKAPFLTALKIGDLLSYWSEFNSFFMRAAGIGLVVLMVLNFSSAQSKANAEQNSSVKPAVTTENACE
ncbi:hypothetical protein [Alcaligenes endophyticus]|uniref:Uncharacterized protein n=1 Tax=Alcaligenes endophyticus TaxID=1929088 RepID=A0ABT8EKD9_9BURK|nr:hypothetical protein [Alcaligenes endophyticus]MCX5590889.1 hypothetical protein [Alcaligenes endophyticus]MDN4121749.1 hypothetical protein [Alcaligenes endophyticus]